VTNKRVYKMVIECEQNVRLEIINRNLEVSATVSCLLLLCSISA